MGWRSVLAVPVVLLAVLVFWLNEPLYPNTTNPVKYKLMAGILKVHFSVSALQAWWTGEDFRLVQARHLRAAMFHSRLQDPDIMATDENFDGVPVFIYQPKTHKKNRPALVYYHGGGFQTGHAVGFESMLFQFVKKVDMVVVSVDYRLTPNVKAPVPHEDCMKATQHLFRHAEKYGVNPQMIGAGGDSAGGNLASSMSLQLRDKGEDQFIFQLLIYPWVQGLDMQTPSYQQKSKNAPILMTHESMASFLGSFLGVPPEQFPDLIANRHVHPETWDKYKKYFNIEEIPKESIPSTYKPIRPKEINKALADLIQDDLTNPYLFPLLADDLTDLPPTYILSVEDDPIRDEAIWFANRLKRARNKVLHYHAPDGFHPMMSFQEPLAFDAAVRVTEYMVSFAQEVLNDLKDGSKPSKRSKVDQVKPSAQNPDHTEAIKVASSSQDAKQPEDSKWKSVDLKKEQKEPKADIEIPAEPPIVQSSSDTKP